VPDPEHPAAKAGRFVRAVGLGIARELEKRADAPAKAQAQPVAPPPPPPPVPTGGFLGTAILYAFLSALGAFVLAVLQIDSLVNGTAKTVFRLVLAAVLLVAAALLTSNWQLASQRLAQRMLTRMWGPRGAVNRRERFVSRRVRDVLTLVGILFLATGVFEFLRATVGT
jgi:hypothetical protein